MPLENNISEVSKQRIAYLEALAMQIEEQLEKKNGKPVKIKEYDEKEHKMVSKEYSEAKARKKIEDMEREIQKLRGVPWYERNNRGILAVLATAVRTVINAIEFLNPATWMGLKLGMEDVRRDMEREQELKDRMAAAAQPATGEKEQEEYGFKQQEQEFDLSRDFGAPDHGYDMTHMKNAEENDVLENQGAAMEEKAKAAVDKVYSMANRGKGFEERLQSFSRAMAQGGISLDRREAIVKMIAKDPNQIRGIPKEELDQSLLRDILLEDATVLLDKPDIEDPMTKRDLMTKDCVTLIAKEPSVFPMMKEAIKDTGLLYDRQFVSENGKSMSIFNTGKILERSSAELQSRNPEFVNAMPKEQITEKMAKILYDKSQNKEQLFFTIPKTENGDILFERLNNLRPEAEWGLPPVKTNGDVQIALYETIVAMQRNGLSREAALQAAIERYPDAKHLLLKKDRAIIDPEFTRQADVMQNPQPGEGEFTAKEEHEEFVEDIQQTSEEEILEEETPELEEEEMVEEAIYRLMDMADGKAEASMDVIRGIPADEIVDQIMRFSLGNTATELRNLDFLKAQGETEAASLLREKIETQMEAIAGRIMSDEQAVIQARDSLMKDRSGNNLSGLEDEQELLQKILENQPDFVAQQQIIDGLSPYMQRDEKTYITMAVTNKQLVDMIPMETLVIDGFAEDVVNQIYDVDRIREYLAIPATTPNQRMLSAKMAEIPGENLVPEMVYAQDEKLNNELDGYVREIISSESTMRDVLMQKNLPQLLSEMVQRGYMGIDQAYDAMQTEPEEMPEGYKGILVAHGIIAANCIPDMKTPDLNVLSGIEKSALINELDVYIDEDSQLRYDIKNWIDGHNDVLGEFANGYKTAGDTECEHDNDAYNSIYDQDEREF